MQLSWLRSSRSHGWAHVPQTNYQRVQQESRDVDPQNIGNVPQELVDNAGFANDVEGTKVNLKQGRNVFFKLQSRDFAPRPPQPGSREAGLV